MKSIWRKFSALLFATILLLTNGRLSFSENTAMAQASQASEQPASVSTNPREDVIFLKEEMAKFEERMFSLIQGKSAEEATEVFREELELFYDIVGYPFKWRYEDFYAFVTSWTNMGIQWPVRYYYERGLPQEDELTEDEAIEIARNTVLFFAGIPPEELDLCWPMTSYRRPVGGQYSWDVDFVMETPESDFPYYVRFMLEIDPKTGTIYSYFDSRSNEY